VWQLLPFVIARHPIHVIPNVATRLFPPHVFCAPGRGERNLSSSFSAAWLAVP
jgi:hypothetical protein